MRFGQTLEAVVMAAGDQEIGTQGNDPLQVRVVEAADLNAGFQLGWIHAELTDADDAVAGAKGTDNLGSAGRDGHDAAGDLVFGGCLCKQAGRERDRADSQDAQTDRRCE